MSNRPWKKVYLVASSPNDVKNLFEAKASAIQARSASFDVALFTEYKPDAQARERFRAIHKIHSLALRACIIRTKVLNGVGPRPGRISDTAPLSGD